jgi:hypothetical protein
VKFTEITQIIGLLFPQEKMCTNCDKNCVGLLFGRLFKTHLVTLMSDALFEEFHKNSAQNLIWTKLMESRETNG